MKIMTCQHHFIKSVRIQSYSGPHFSAFGLNTEREYLSVFSLNGGKCRPNRVTFYTVHIIMLLAPLTLDWHLLKVHSACSVIFIEGQTIR